MGRGGAACGSRLLDAGLKNDGVHYVCTRFKVAVLLLEVRCTPCACISGDVVTAYLVMLPGVQGEG